MKRILLPTDFSENAYNAIVYALKLHKHDVCQFFLLHAYSPVYISSGSLLDSQSALRLQQNARDAVQLELDNILDRLNEEYPNSKHNFTTVAAFNMLIPEMQDLVAENDIDMVIMGTKGATGAKEVFLGTHTMYAIKKLKCPVLAVPAKFVYEEPKEILFPTDYKVKRDNKYLSLVREICDTHISRLHLLNAYYGTPLSNEQLNIKAFLDAYFIDNAHLFHISEGKDVLEAVQDFQIRAKINFMVMIHNKHTFFENLLFKPVINQVVFHTNVPFLVIPSVALQG